ncbi:ATP-binding protein [Thalassospira profundimaris]|uniref:ATP-binding protein n=1 Tax=Thalassospira profundimaris TaxID=502049 RepID=UPI000DEE03B7|nr:ATP-binding protein [Thalassospira profundimaris]
MTPGDTENRDSPHPLLRPRDVVIPFRKRILIATGLILSLIFADGVVDYMIEHARQETTLQINMSGRQRMLSQRINGFSQMLAQGTQTTAAESNEIRLALKDAIDLMESSHRALVDGNQQLALPPSEGVIRRYYLEGKPSLDSEVRSFLEAAKRVLNSTDPGQSRVVAIDAEYIHRTAFKPLLEMLDRTVTLYQRDAERQLMISTQVSLVTRGALILCILGVIFGVVWPMIAIIRTNLQQFATERNRANAASQAKSEFLATVSHEIRTPMNSILGLSGLLARGDMAANLQRYAVLINESAKTLMAIVNDVLDLSKIEAGKLEIEHIVFSPQDVVRNTVGSFSSIASDKELDLRTIIADDTPDFVEGDPTRLRQILANFLSNALKFTETGNVTVNLYRSDRLSEHWADVVVLRLEVTDTGIGFGDETRKNLFEAFNQADQSTTRKYGGTGLGLAIAKRLTEAMGGKIDASAVPGKGAKFWVDVPFTPVHPALNEQSRLVAEHYSPELPTLENSDVPLDNFIKVLVVDDKELNRIVIGAFLDKGPYEISYACDGREAVEKAVENRYDLILMDAQMPVMDGTEALHAIRRTPGPSRNAKIIVVTADALEQAESRYLAIGFDGYLSKPLTPETLARVLRAVM